MQYSSAEMLARQSRSEQCLAMNAQLNVEGLKIALSRATGFHCSGLTLKAEGGFHRIYFAHCDGGKEFVARVAYDHVAYRGYRKMESEVATIAWVADNTDIPVPKVLYYDPTAQNEARAPFMVLEKVGGMTLAKRWSTMSPDEKLVAVRALAKIIIALAQTRFDRIGSLYPSSAHGRFIGPILPRCAPWFFTRDASLEAGPWRTEREYLLTCIARERTSTLAHQSELELKWRNEDLTAIGWESVLSGYLSTYDRLTKVVSSLPGLDQRLPHPFGPFVLSHPDLTDTNIMISSEDPSQLTLLDWDCAGTTPLWNLTCSPEFLVSEDTSALRDAFDAECEARFPDPALWRAQSNKACLMFWLERACQAISMVVSPAMLANMLDEVLSKQEYSTS